MDLTYPYFPNFLEKGVKRSLISYFGEKLPARHLVSFVELGGWFSADQFLEWLAGKLDSGTVAGKKRSFSKMTLEEFYQATGRDLTLCVTDTTWHMMLALNHRTAPDMPNDMGSPHVHEHPVVMAGGRLGQQLG